MKKLLAFIFEKKVKDSWYQEDYDGWKQPLDREIKE